MEVFSQYFLITDLFLVCLESVESSALLCHASSNDPLVLSILQLELTRLGTVLDFLKACSLRLSVQKDCSLRLSCSLYR